MRTVVGLLLLVVATGCGSMNPPANSEPVKISGQVLGADGKPIGDVTLNLQPLETGFARTIDVASTGSFSVETEPGKYAYFFSPKAKAKTAPPQVADYLQASLDRTVTVVAGQELKVQLPK